MKKLAVFLLCACVGISLIVMHVAASFDDMDGHWSFSSVERWYDAGILNGDGSGNFNPDKETTRAEFAQILCELMGYTQKAANTFVDVPDDAWYTDAILKLVGAGVMAGVGDNMAEPDTPITREQTAVLLCRAMGIKPSENAAIKFDDAVNISDWARDAVSALAERGMVNGVGDNSFAPALNIDRASVAKMVDNIVAEYVTESGAVISGNISGVVIIKADDVKLENVTLSETVILSPAAGNTTVTLSGMTQVQDVVVAAEGAKIVVEETASAGGITVEAPGAIAEIAGKVDKVTVTDSADNTTVTAETGAKVDNVIISAEDVKVNGADGAIASITADKGSADIAAKGAEVSNTGAELKINDDTVDTDDTAVSDKAGADIDTDTGTLASDGITSGDAPTGGSTSGGSSSDDIISGYRPSGGGTSGGGISGDITFGNDSSDDNDSGDDTSDDNASDSDTSDDNTSGGDTSDDNASDGDTSDDNASGENSSDDNDSNGSSSSENTSSEKSSVPEYVTYTITFDVNGGTSEAPKPAKTNADGRITFPEGPVNSNTSANAKKPLTFAGWYDSAIGGNKLDSDTVFLDDQTIYAHWTVVGGWDWELADGTLRIYGTSDMTFDSGVSSWEDDGDPIINVVIEDGITSIGEFAFSNCIDLTHVTIPDSVKSIGKSAFSGCDVLTDVTIPYGVESIDGNAFSNCFSLTDIVIPNSVTSIGEEVFYNCTSLESVAIGCGLTCISDNAFSGCWMLSSVIIPEGVTSIGGWAFFDCTGLTEITIPSSVILIGRSAFQDCVSLDTVNYSGTEDEWENLMNAAQDIGLDNNEISLIFS